MESAPSSAVVFAKRARKGRARVCAHNDDPVDLQAGGSGVDADTAVVRRPKAHRTATLAAASAPPKGPPAAAATAAVRSLFHETAAPSDARISSHDHFATASNEQEVARDRDAQAQFEEARRLQKDGGGVAADGSLVYRGQKAYHNYTERTDDFGALVRRGVGPARAPTNFRAISRVDYQPDVCKDFRDTGFCGYGDACIFLHDRSDYKTGWQLEKDWEETRRKRELDEAAVLLGGEAPPAEDGEPEGEALPFACLICREPWHARSKPVVTKCEHYFCEQCALRHYRKTRSCFACSEQTGGIFNHARAIQARMELKAQGARAGDAARSSLS